MPRYRVQLLDFARQDLKELDGSTRKLVVKQLRKLEISSELGTPCENSAGIGLTGWLKIYLKSAGLRIIYQIVKKPSRENSERPEDQGVVDVLAIGPRNDLAVYRNAAQELKRLGRHRSSQ
jgi:mRNA interferase RelE/StbE